MSQPPIRLLHFADAHIDMANFGRHDPESGLPVRVVDFLRALDQIVDAAIEAAVDLVLFAGDAYKDRNPHPTFQREWGRRMMRLSQAGIPTLLLVGNHDVSPATGRAHALQEFGTLAVEHIHVADAFRRLGPDTLGRPVQVITVPWVSRSALLRRDEMLGLSGDELLTEMEERLTQTIEQLIDSAEPDLPLILTAHASVAGAQYGSERAVMLGHELVLGGQILRHPRLDYVALGHIHRHQSLNDGGHPPIVYPGSIERVDFGELREKKGYVLAEVARGRTTWRFVPLPTRRFLSYEIAPAAAESFMEDVLSQLPEPDEVAGAICRVVLTYPRDWEPLLDEPAIAARFESALSYQLQKVRRAERRSRLGDTVATDGLDPLALLDLYWKTRDYAEDEAATLQALAAEVLTVTEEEEPPGE